MKRILFDKSISFNKVMGISMICTNMLHLCCLIHGLFISKKIELLRVGVN